MSRRPWCAICGRVELELVLDLGTAPLADEFPHVPNLDQQRFPLQMFVCHGCGLAQLGEVVSDDLLWAGDYAFYSGSSPTVVTYYEQYAEWLRRTYPRLLSQGTVVEIACNDGTLLKAIRDGSDTAPGPYLFGVDPAPGPVAVASGHGLNVERAIFDKAYAEVTKADIGPAALVIANNVAAHVTDPVDFFTGIRTLLDDDGVAIVEVQYLPDLLLGNDFPLLYHEHRFYYSLRSLTAAVSQADLIVTNAWLTEPQGGSLRVELRVNRGATTAFTVDTNNVGRIRGAEKWLTPVAFAGLQGRAERLRTRLLEMLYDEVLAGRTVAGYGASAKAATLLSWLGQTLPPQSRPGHVVGGHPNNELISWFVDTTPTKVGRFMPGTGIPVVTRTRDFDFPDGPDTYLVCIWNYLGHVLRNEADWLARTGTAARQHKMILPVPVPKLI